ncbi:glycosyltransferase family 92 protein [Pararhizobium sp. IMCC21322]|uniref:glycosyltransferase family 92 protein n=1 Tax=Pararhizobium sp. IMCC21322 TaxID=3067903 RepID=UPI0027415694|nr:glycosyltransferase family 92 protein [Pararhizobium sp. IMCC21322]
MAIDARVRSGLRQFRKLLKSKRRRGSETGNYRIPRTKPLARSSEGLACVTILKNEEDYLDEWIEFHLMMGFDHFFIYDNGSTDNTLDILAKYQQRGVVTVIPWCNFSQVLHPQKAANAHAIANFCTPYRWVAFFDVDEFLFSPTSETLTEALEKVCDQICVSIPWQNFGPNGHKSKPEGLVIENYTEKGAFPPVPEQRSLLRYKTILDPTKVLAAGTHCFHFIDVGPMLINERGETMQQHQFEDVKFAVSEHFQLNHYFTRSEQELEKKRQKGRVSSKGAKVSDFVDNRLNQYKISTCEDLKILQFLPRLKDTRLMTH